MGDRGMSPGTEVCFALSYVRIMLELYCHAHGRWSPLLVIFHGLLLQDERINDRPKSSTVTNVLLIMRCVFTIDIFHT